MRGFGEVGERRSQAANAVLALLFAGIVFGGVAVAQTKRTGGPSPSPAGAEVYFIDLKDGATVPAKLKLYFGLRNMGVAPAGSDRENSGHHHLLIDAELPPLDQPIPNDFNHLHFGAGQTEAEITLKPGSHTLQLLLGDKNHVPHTPPVMSPRIRVNVTLTGGPTASAPGAAVYITDLQDGATIDPTVTVHFGLKNMGVAPAGSDRANSGHHHLLIDSELPPLDQPIPNDFNHLHFGAGQTEATITLKAGDHTLQLLLGDKDHIPHTPPVVSPRIKVRVVDASTRTPAPADAQVYFVGLKDGAVLPAKAATIHFGLVNMGVAPAGIEKPNTGHHHLLIDAKVPPLDQPIPNDFNHLHFGAGQTEATVDLPLGKHTLQLLLGDAKHIPHNPPVMSKPINVTVTRPGESAPDEKAKDVDKDVDKERPARRASAPPEKPRRVADEPPPRKPRAAPVAERGGNHWCAAYSSGAQNCGFSTFEQCRATVSGVGGSCRPD
jgi:Domain of unknown function (DUF4399)